MICPRCSVGEIAPLSGYCVLCGYSVEHKVAVQPPVVDEVSETIQRELGGRFRIRSLLRRGPRSMIYEADDGEHEQRVALKVVPVPRGFHPNRHRFERDAAIAASLDHPHVLSVVDYGMSRGLFWITTELGSARSLGEILQESGAIDVDRCQRILDQVASALDYMHRRGVVHGNLKPANILLDEHQWVRVTDARMARIFDPPAGARPVRPIGTAEFMAPEQFDTRVDGAAGDQYALAVIAYEALTGVLPFVGDSQDELERQQKHEAPPRLSAARSDLPEHLEAPLQRALSKRPIDRFPTVLDFVATLRGDWTARSDADLMPSERPSGSPVLLVVDEKPAEKGRRGRVAVVGGVAVAVAVAGWATWSKLSQPPPTPIPDRVVAAPVTVNPPPDAVAAILDPTPAGENPTVEPLVAEAEAAPAPPAPAPPPAVVPEPTVPAAPAPPPATPGRLFINASPWGQVFVDGVLVGNTPRANLEISAGVHRIRVVRDGYEPFEREINVAPGQRIRLLDIVLRPRSR